MTYFVIHKGSSPIAVVFHDYLSQYFFVRSKSEAFRRAFDASVNFFFKGSLKKKDKKLYPVNFGPEYSEWIKEVLKKSCGSFWKIEKIGKLSSREFEEDVIKRYLFS